MNLSPSFYPAALDDPDALYYAALDYEPVAEPHALDVLPFCGLPDPTRLPGWDPAIDSHGRCPFHSGAPLYLGWQGPECPLGVRARYEATGYRCGGQRGPCARGSEAGPRPVRQARP